MLFLAILKNGLAYLLTRYGTINGVFLFIATGGTLFDQTGFEATQMQ
ncbi:jg4977, partial [Pararge aegeria aegeria]